MTVSFPSPFSPPVLPVSDASNLTPAGYHPRVAGWIAIGALGVAFTFALLLATAFPAWAWENLKWFIALTLATFLLSFSGFVIFWQMRMVNKPVSLLEKEHKKQMEILQAEVDKLRASPEYKLIELVEGPRLEYVALKILYRVYAEKREGTRETCAEGKSRFCTQNEWKTVSDIFDYLGIKKDSTFGSGTYEQAVKVWSEQVYPWQEGLFVKGRGVWGRENVKKKG